jgi:hypothetical protein
MVHARNHSYLGGGHQENCYLRLAHGEKFARPQFSK